MDKLRITLLDGNSGMTASIQEMYFSKDNLRKLHEEYEGMWTKYPSLVNNFLTFNFKDQRAREHAHHGFLRRAKTLVRCVDNVFRILPPDREDIPTDDELFDATVNIQAFVFNTFGAIDNLAWIWVSEKGIRKPDGSEIPDIFIGLRKRNKFVRDSLSTVFRDYLSSFDKWFENLDNFRHALAHRIPLYIPPFIVSPENEQRYRELEDLKWTALSRLDFAEHDRLDIEQKKLGFFRPWMTHSFSEKAKHVVFHAQLLADFNTVEELARKFLEELAPKKS